MHFDLASPSPVQSEQIQTHKVLRFGFPPPSPIKLAFESRRNFEVPVVDKKPSLENQLATVTEQTCNLEKPLSEDLIMPLGFPGSDFRHQSKHKVKVNAHPLERILRRFVFFELSVIIDGINKSKRGINSILARNETRRSGCSYHRDSWRSGKPE